MIRLCSLQVISCAKIYGIIQGINGRRMYQTWYQMTALLKAGKLDLHPVITDRIAMKDFSKGMERLKTGVASKILVYPNGSH
jgi:threonine 3-dehydrogenase